MPNLPRRPFPTEPGWYVCSRPRCIRFLVEIREKEGQLRVVNSPKKLADFTDGFQWWGPFELAKR